MNYRTDTVEGGSWGERKEPHWKKCKRNAGLNAKEEQPSPCVDCRKGAGGGSKRGG